MSEPVSKSADQEQEALLADLAANGILYYGKTGETNADAYNRRLAIETLRQWAVQNSVVTVDVDAEDGDEIDVEWPTAFGTTPTMLPFAPSFYPDDSESGLPVFAAYKPGTLSTTGVTVVLSSSRHGGGKLAVGLPF